MQAAPLSFEAQREGSCSKPDYVIPLDNGAVNDIIHATAKRFVSSQVS